MRREDFAAAAAPALRRLCAKLEPASDKNVPMAAVGALIVGMLVSVSLLAATESPSPAVEQDATSATPVAMLAEVETEDIARLSPRGYSTVEDSTQHTARSTRNSDLRWFNNRPVRPVKTIEMVVTAYSPDEQSCGIWADGFTASGYSVWTNGMKLVAADTAILPFGSLVSVPGYDDGDVVPVLDRGGAIKGHRLDVLYPTHQRALEWGVQRLEVTVWEYADGEPNGFSQQHHRR